MSDTITMEQTNNSVEEFQSALWKLDEATSEILNAWHGLKQERRKGDKEAEIWEDAINKTYCKTSPFKEIMDSYEVVPIIVREWIDDIVNTVEKLEEKQEEVSHE